MAHSLRWRTRYNVRAACLFTLSLLSLHSSSARAETFDSRIVTRPEMTAARRDQLAVKLSEITGWKDLSFSEDGQLRLGKDLPSGGSETARKLLAQAVSGEKLIVLEDASNRADVVFCQMVEGRWTKNPDAAPSAFIILIDFTDFARVTGDRAALAAFNVGWGVLHEIDHVVHDSIDTESAYEAGECEDAVNRMRRECGLAERAEYHFTFFPGASDGNLSVKLVRLAFEQREPAGKKKKRYWLLWDANLVGGLNETKLSAHR